MIKTLAKSIREYKKPSILAPVFIAGEVVIECFIPYITAMLVSQIQANCGIEVIVNYGVILVILALCSLTCGALAGHFAAIASCGFAKNLRYDAYCAIQNYSFSNMDKFLFCLAKL